MNSPEISIVPTWIAGEDLRDGDIFILLAGEVPEERVVRRYNPELYDILPFGIIKGNHRAGAVLDIGTNISMATPTRVRNLLAPEHIRLYDRLIGQHLDPPCASS